MAKLQLKENDDVKIPTKIEKPAPSHGFFSLFSKETPAAQPTALQNPVKNQTSPLEAHRKDVFKLCSDFLLHEKQKAKTDKDAEQRAINKTKLLNKLIKFLDENKFHDFDNFSAAYKKNKENLRQPTRFIGSSQGEKFTNAVDKILDSIKAEQPTMLSHKKT